MNTYTALLVTYGRPQVPLTVIAKDYFPEMSERTVKTRAATQQLPFPVMRGESQKATFLVDLHHLAKYLDSLKAEAEATHSVMASIASPRTYQ